MKGNCKWNNNFVNMFYRQQEEKNHRGVKIVKKICVTSKTVDEMWLLATVPEMGYLDQGSITRETVTKL